MQAWGSILSLVVSTGALIFAGWLLRHEIRVRREEKADSDAAQARLVVGRITGWHGKNEKYSLHGPIRDLEWEIKNYSEAPLLDPKIAVIVGPGTPAWCADLWGSVIEKEARGIVSGEPPIVVDQGQYFDPRELEVQIWFTDAAGLRWTRISGEPPKRDIPRLPSGLRVVKGWSRFLRRRKPDDEPPF